MIPEIRTYSGHLINLEAPDLLDIQIDDIARALSHICRFTGHSPQFYSVAQHSFWCAHNCGSNPQVRFAALMHDAHEAYVGDMSSPLKVLVPEYRKVDDMWTRAVADRFGIDQSAEVVAEVKRVDTRAVYLELDALWSNHETKYACPPGPGEEICLPGWSPESARRAFLETYYLLEDMM